MRIGRHDVPISNPDKVFFPARGLTKGDLVSYYLDLADCVLPHLRRRPFHMKRFPNGVEGEFFHQKRVPAKHPPYVGEIPVSFPSGHSTVFALVDNAAALAWVVEPRLHRAAHVALARARDRAARLPADRPRPERGQPVGVRARDRARRPRGDGRARARVVPEDVGRDRPPHPRADPAGAARSRRCGGSRRRSPRRSSAASATSAIATTTWRVADRKGVFVDFGQNARDRTIACAYSVRPTPDARVSAPLDWDEVADVDPAAFTVETMRARLAAVGDPMRGMWRRAASLRPRFERLGLEPPA